jgi:hypothetical protein
LLVVEVEVVMVNLVEQVVVAAATLQALAVLE